MQPTIKASTAYIALSEEMAAEVSRKLLSRADVDKLIGGPANREMMQDNDRNHARFFSSLFQNYNPEVLVNTVLWVFSAYRHHGFNLIYWPAQLDAWVEILRITLEEDAFSQVYPFYHWMIVNNPIFAALSSDNSSNDFKIEGHY